MRLRDRLGLQGLDYEIPAVATRLPYYLGAMTLTSILVAAVTGIYLEQFYQPSPLGAHASVVYTIEHAPFGDLARNLHRRAADAAVLVVALHLSWVFYRGSYQAPREITWWAGVGMLGCLFLLYFTGTTLPYDQEGYEALAHNISAAERVGPLGAFLTADFTPSTSLLARLYALHVSALPLLLLGLLSVHLYLIRYLGIHALPGEQPGGASFRAYARRMGAYVAWWAAALIALSLVWPQGLGHPAVPGSEVTKPPWPFLWFVTLENQWGIGALAIVVPILFVALVLIPLVDRRREDSAPGRRWRVWILALAWAAWLALTLIAALAPQRQHLGR
jgi:ubiquinol-cytochrome c reductase cytochrome b subunit